MNEYLWVVGVKYFREMFFFIEVLKYCCLHIKLNILLVQVHSHSIQMQKMIPVISDKKVYKVVSVYAFTKFNHIFVHFFLLLVIN